MKGYFLYVFFGAAKVDLLRNLIILSLLITVLASCSLSTVLPVDIVKVTNTYLPTKTKAPYPTPTLRSTSSPTLSLAVSPSGTPDLAISILNSPDGDYVAKLYSPRESSSNKPFIEIFDSQNKPLWKIPFQGNLPEGDPRPGLILYKWSNDSSQLYFHYVWSPDGGDWSFWWSGYDLQVLDVKTGKIRRVLPGSGFMSFEISPQGTQIAYTREQDKPSIIYIQDLVTGVVRKTTVLPTAKNYARSGDIHWSPSGQKVAFQTETDDGIVRTIYLNVATMEQSVIKEYQLFTLLFDGWADDGKLQFAEFSADGMRVDKVYKIDVTTSETMLIGTPTVRP